MKKERTYITKETIDMIEAERERHFTIINYILNKNSHPLPRGVDYENLFEDLQDYEHYLRN